MIRRIAFIHTVAMLVERFRPRFQAELPGTDCFHMLDESVLQDLLRSGPSPSITRRICSLATLAADAGAELIVFTCSSTSPAIDTARQQVGVPILKIDDPLYAQACNTPGQVGLVCTTASTVGPSRALFDAHAATAGHALGAQSVLCSAAFDALVAGRRDEHDRLVTDAAMALAGRVDRIVLAQASLAHLAEPLAAALGKPVLASPELMVREVVDRVRAAA
ncbi:MAG: Asp/Glu/hydantoin racemase [Comamonadaceae bacterium]|nr:MAG: Asp/Glu/hydantoin racemase [Comamonadaceae bacterium]